MAEDWLVRGSCKDRQSITSDWDFVEENFIEGVRLRRVRHVVKNQGYLTELYRTDWGLDESPVDQVFQQKLAPGQISAWHAHEETRDRLFVSIGMARIVLFDNRAGSPTRGALNEFRIGTLSPALLIIPPRVWHGVQNIGTTLALVLNLVDRAYRYERPDHWRVAPNCPEIPFSWDNR